jgi:hypothetical protein
MLLRAHRCSVRNDAANSCCGTFRSCNSRLGAFEGFRPRQYQGTAVINDACLGESAPASGRCGRYRSGTVNERRVRPRGVVDFTGGRVNIHVLLQAAALTHAKPFGGAPATASTGGVTQQIRVHSFHIPSSIRACFTLAANERESIYRLVVS